jgi:transcription elongation factor GreA
MRLPQRRSQMMVKHGPETDHLTEESVNRLKRTLNELEKVERPKIVVDLAHAITLGDFSENAEYQDAKARLARIDGRIFGMKERIKHAIVIASGSADGKIGLGSTVDLIINSKQKSYRILGPQEADPSKGRISHLSPLGSALMGKAAGDIVDYKTPDGLPSQVEIVNVS